MSIGEDFKKDLYEEFKDKSGVLISAEIFATWGAKWMAERLAVVAEGHMYVRNRPIMDQYELDHNNLCEVIADDARQLAQELTAKEEK